jgi:hypothetical protein
MTLTEVFFFVAAASAFSLMAFTVISIAKPAARSEMGIQLHGDSEDNGYTRPDIDADEF